MGIIENLIGILGDIKGMNGTGRQYNNSSFKDFARNSPNKGSTPSKGFTFFETPYNGLCVKREK